MKDKLVRLSSFLCRSSLVLGLVFFSAASVRQAQAGIAFDTSSRTAFCSSTLNSALNNASGYMGIYGGQLATYAKTQCASGQYLSLPSRAEWTAGKANYTGSFSTSWTREAGGSGVYYIKGSDTGTYSAASNNTTIDVVPIINLLESGVCADTSSEPYTLVKDTTKPTGSISYSGANRTSVTTGPSVTLTRSDTGGCGLTSGFTMYRGVAQYRNGSCGTYTWTAATTAQTALTYADSANLTDGNCYKYKARYYDLANNYTDYEGSGVVTVDVTKPSGGGISYTGGIRKTTTNSTALTITKATDAYSGLKSTYTIQRGTADWSNAGVCGTYTWANLTTTQSSSTLTYTDTTAMANAKCYMYRVIFYDNQGNSQTWTGSNVIKVDTTAPTATLVHDNKFVTSSQNVVLTLSGLADTGGSTLAAIANYKVERATTALFSGACKESNWSAWSEVTNKSSDATAKTITDKTGLTSDLCYKWRVTIADVAGNTTVLTSNSRIKADFYTPAVTCSIIDPTGLYYHPSSTLFYYNPSTTNNVTTSNGSGSFKVKASIASVPASGITSVVFPALVSTTTSTSANTDAGAAAVTYTTANYTKPYSWTSATTASLQNQEIIVNYGNGTSNKCTVSAIYDAAGPTGTSMSYTGGYTKVVGTGLTFPLGLNVSSIADSPSGVNRLALYHMVGNLIHGECDYTGASFTQIGTDIALSGGQVSGTYNFISVNDNKISIIDDHLSTKCYRYRAIAIDNAHNTTTYTHPATYDFKVSSEVPTIAIYSVKMNNTVSYDSTNTGDVRYESVYYDKVNSTLYYNDGANIFYKPTTDSAGIQFTVTADSQEDSATIDYVKFSDLSGNLQTGTPINTGGPYIRHFSYDYTIPQNTSTSYYDRIIQATSKTDVSSRELKFNIVGDAVAPRDVSITCPDSYQVAVNGYVITANYGVDNASTDSGLKTSASYITRKTGVLRHGECTYATDAFPAPTDSDYTGTAYAATAFNEVNLQSQCYQYQVVSYDVVGNVTKQQCEVKADVTDPSLDFTPPEALWTPTRQDIVVTAADIYSGLKRIGYSWDAPLEAGCNGGISITSGTNIGSTQPEGEHHLYVCSLDYAGHAVYGDAVYNYSPAPDFIDAVDNVDSVDLTWNVRSVQNNDAVIIEGDIPAIATEKHYEITVEVANTTIARSDVFDTTPGKARSWSIAIPIDDFKPYLSSTKYTFPGPHTITIRDTQTNQTVVKDYNITFYFPIYNNLQRVNYSAFMLATDYRVNVVPD